MSIHIIKNNAAKEIKKLLKMLENESFLVSPVSEKEYSYEAEIRSSAGKDKLKLQVFFGKKGRKTIIQGAKDKPIYDDVSNLIFGEKLFDNRPEFNEPDAYIGTDESGKGDYFGPLVIAGVYVDKKMKDELLSFKVRDSKLMSDNEIKIVAGKINQKYSDKIDVVSINPEKYNQLYLKFNNVNRMLAWGHAKVIENILEKNPAPEVISDKFGDESLIRNSLQQKGREIQLHQFTKAEKYIGVAAASILARAKFINWFDRIKKETGYNLSKGASSHVDKIASSILQKEGEEVLKKLVKFHFKNTKNISANKKG